MSMRVLVTLANGLAPRIIDYRLFALGTANSVRYNEYLIDFVSENGLQIPKIKVLTAPNLM